MIKFFKKLLHPFLKRYLFWYFSKARWFRYGAIKVKVYPSVFPPHYTISTKLLLQYLRLLDLDGKKVLELGCGSGVVSIFAAKQGALVTASDINQVAIQALEENSKINQVAVKGVYSNLFENLTLEDFDLILINPPYYPNKPSNISEYAWFCGENFEYFERLFNQLSNSKNSNVSVLMILSETCNLKVIFKIARLNKLQLTEVFKKAVYGEQNFIFEINSIVNE